MSSADVETFLRKLNPTVIRPGLQRIRLLLEALGRPDADLSSVLIAGTNGKGSVAACLSSILSAAGLRVGTYTSPHLRRLEERIKVQGESITREALEHHFGRVKNALESPEMQSADEVTYFEFLTAVAIDYFGRLSPDWCVLEVGLGGRWDAVNAVEPKICVITPIGIDHTAFLGTTISAIAKEKAAVIRPGRPVVCARQSEAALRIVEATCHERKAPLSTLGRAFRVRHVKKAEGGGQFFTYMEAGLNLEDLFLPLLGPHQAENASCAVRAFRQICNEGLARWSEKAVRGGLASVRIEGRLQELSKDPLVVVDGAHNELGAQTLAKAIRVLWPRRDLTMVFGVLSDKEYLKMAEALFPLASQVVLVPVESFPERSADPESVASRTVGFAKELMVASDLSTAIETALAELPAGGVCIITGSLYLAGEAISYFETRSAPASGSKA